MTGEADAAPEGDAPRGADAVREAPAGGPADGPAAPEGPAYDRHMLEALICPLTQGRLDWDAAAGELISRAAGLAYPVRGGIPIMLEAEARRLD